MAKKNENVNSGETKSESFVRLAESRTGKAIHAIRQLKSLGNKNAYDYTSDQVQLIEDALMTEVAAACDGMRTGKSVSTMFKLG